MKMVVTMAMIVIETLSDEDYLRKKFRAILRKSWFID